MITQLTLLRCRNLHTIKHLDACFYGQLARAGLLSFALMMQGANQEDGTSTPIPRVDEALLTGLVDRWRPETHTFHLPFGEMTVTFKDVTMLTGMPIRGKPVISRRPTRREWQEYLQDRYIIEHHGALLFQNILGLYVLHIH